jgi:hypothetical protein
MDQSTCVLLCGFWWCLFWDVGYTVCNVHFRIDTQRICILSRHLGLPWIPGVRAYDFACPGGIIMNPSQGNYICMELNKGWLIFLLPSVILRLLPAPKTTINESSWLWRTCIGEQQERQQLVNATRAYKVSVQFAGDRCLLRIWRPVMSVLHWAGRLSY